MIESVHIKNFKSIYDLEIEVGRVNLIIGENGSGKSNLLEALVFVAASESNKLDNEFLSSRGIRVTEPTLMRSAFKDEDKNKDIEIDITVAKPELKIRQYVFKNANLERSNWVEESTEINQDIESWNTVLPQLKDIAEKFQNRQIKVEFDELHNKEEELRILQNIMKTFAPKIDDINNFLIYSPENTALRNFYKEGQIEPLGINGEGLLRLLKTINRYEDKSYMEEIINSLRLFSWFEDIEIPSSLPFGEDKVVIKDRFLYREIDQRSANEGFLFILFYITLLVAKETPKVFAIDNIDASLNPKLCTKLMSLIATLAAKYDKQVFLTTHNPAMLDGIDLNDDNQRLFVMSRNKDGHTRAKRIGVEDKPKSSDDEPLKLSEAFLRGYLGGLPKGF